MRGGWKVCIEFENKSSVNRAGEEAMETIDIYCMYIEDRVKSSVAEPHHFYAAPAPDPAQSKNFDAAPERIYKN
jgi:hypothetical protein